MAAWGDAGGIVDPPRPIAPLHLHHSDDEAWYVLEGVLRVRRGDEVAEAGVGESVLVPHGIPHTYWNGSAGPLRYLLVMTPRIHQLIEAIHASTDREAASMRALFQKYDSELLG